MRKYIAFHNSSNSGIQTRDKAIEWGSEMLNQTKVTKVHLCEVVEVIERKETPVVLRAFLPVVEDNPQVKAKEPADF